LRCHELGKSRKDGLRRAGDLVLFLASSRRTELVEGSDCLHRDPFARSRVYGNVEEGLGMSIEKHVRDFILEGIAKGIIKVADDQQAEQCDLRLCAENRMSPDNLEGVCADCGRPVFFDPGGPDTPKKICISCALGQKSLSE
jgi:hypothetical protein